MKKIIAWWSRLSEESKTTFVVILGIPMLVAWVLFAVWCLISFAHWLPWPEGMTP